MAEQGENGSTGRSHRQALELLADAPQGRADSEFIALFAAEVIELVNAGLAAVRSETFREGSRTFETVRVRITAAGRKMIKR
jgi:hypothetical protein